MLIFSKNLVFVSWVKNSHNGLMIKIVPSIVSILIMFVLPILCAMDRLPAASYRIFARIKNAICNPRTWVACQQPRTEFFPE